MAELSRDGPAHLAAKAYLSEKLVLDTATETVARFKDVWRTERRNLPLSAAVKDAIDAHAKRVAIYRGG